MTGNKGATNYDGCPFSHARRLQHTDTGKEE